MNNAELTDMVNKLKKRIIEIEAGNNDLSETDTRQGLINPLFRALGWDFSDFDSIKGEVRILKFNEPVDYAFYSAKRKSDKPILLLEAKKLGRNLGIKITSSSSRPTSAQWASSGECCPTETGMCSTTREAAPRTMIRSSSCWPSRQSIRTAALRWRSLSDTS